MDVLLQLCLAGMGQSSAHCCLLARVSILLWLQLAASCTQPRLGLLSFKVKNRARSHYQEHRRRPRIPGSTES